MFGESKEVRDACMAIEQAFSNLYFEGISERDFLKELDSAVRPFVSPVDEPSSVLVSVVGTEMPTHYFLVVTGPMNNSNFERMSVGAPAQSVGSNSACGFIPAEA